MSLTDDYFQYKALANCEHEGEWKDLGKTFAEDGTLVFNMACYLCGFHKYYRMDGTFHSESSDFVNSAIYARLKDIMGVTA